MVIEKMYMNVDDVCKILEVSKITAYGIINQFNEELKARGYYTRPGRISTKYLAEKVYGLKVAE